MKYIRIITILLAFPISTTWAAVYRAADPFDMGAAQANNSTTELYNPAGLVRLETPEVVGAYIWFNQDIKYTGSVTETSGAFQATQNGQASSKFSASLPGFFISTPVTDKLALGFSYTTPYGSPTGPSYAPGAIVGYSYTKLLLNTENYSVALGYKLLEKFYIGAGINYQTMNVDFNNDILAPGNQTFQFNNSADGSGWWWHAGVLYEPSKTTRLGFTYWAGFTEKLSGKSEVQPLDVVDENLKIDLPIPPMYTFSILQALSQNFGLNITVAYTQWSVLSNLLLKNSAVGNVITEGVYNDTWRGTVGPGYKLNDHWFVDGFVRYEQLGINNDIRLPSQPGDANWSIGVGVTYNFTPKISLKTRYIRPFYGVKDIDATTQTNKILYVGHEDRTANVLGAQLIWAF